MEHKLIFGKGVYTSFTRKCFIQGVSQKTSISLVSSLLLEELNVYFYLLLLQLMLCRMMDLKVFLYIIHKGSADSSFGRASDP